MQTQALFLPQFPFLFGGTFIEARIAPAGTGAGGANFPSFSEGLSLRPAAWFAVHSGGVGFPFLFGGTFIEARSGVRTNLDHGNFPSFSEGLSLRLVQPLGAGLRRAAFPFLFGGTFIEAAHPAQSGTSRDAPSISLPFWRDFH